MLLNLLPPIVYVVPWIVALVFAVSMIRNDGGRPERFLLIGVSLMLVSSVIGTASSALNIWLMPRLIETGTDFKTIGQMFSIINFVRGFISLAGIIFLVYAYWKKFKAKPALT